MKLEITARHFFQAPVQAGYVWASCDYSSQELRVAGAFSGDRKIKKIYNLAKEYELGKPLPLDPEGNPYADPYADQHIMALGFIDADIKAKLKDQPWLVTRKDPRIDELRGKKGKVLNFKTIYGGSAFSFAAEMGITLEEAEELLKGYFAGFEELYIWLKTMGIISRKQHWIKTATGKMVFVNEANAKGQGGGGTAERKGCNAAIQSLSASMTKLALPIIRNRFTKLHQKYATLLQGREARLINATHDEVNAIVPGQVEVFAKPHKFKSGVYTLAIREGSNSVEYNMAQDFGNAIKAGMEEAEEIIFQDYLHSDMPAAAELSLATWWEH